MYTVTDCGELGGGELGATRVRQLYLSLHHSAAVFSHLEHQAEDIQFVVVLNVLQQAVDCHVGSRSADPSATKVIQNMRQRDRLGNIGLRTGNDTDDNIHDAHAGRHKTRQHAIIAQGKVPFNRVRVHTRVSFILPAVDEQGTSAVWPHMAPHHTH